MCLILVEFSANINYKQDTKCYGPEFQNGLNAGKHSTWW